MADNSNNRPSRRAPRDIEERTYAFGVRVLRMVRVLPRDVAAMVIARQVARSGTSVGSSTEEARASHSKREFIQKMNYARKEARETFYWLRMIRDVGLIKPGRLAQLIQESEEILKITTAIVKKAGANESK